MTGVCVYPKLHCTECGGTDTVQRWKNPDGTTTASCMKCKHYYDSISTSKLEGADVVIEQEPKDYTDEVKEILEEYPVKALPDRGLKVGALKHFGVKVGLSPSNGQDIIEHYYPYREGKETTAYKVRIVGPKKFFCKGNIRQCDPFGWREALESGGYTLYITEGELDALALWTTFKRKKDQNVAVISLKQGSQSGVKTLQPVLKDITDKWKKVVLVLDQDESGQEGVKDILNLFPESYDVAVSKFTEKDANAMLLGGKEGELISACYSASKPLSAGIKEFTSSDFDLIKEAPEMGISYPWRGLTDLLRGIRLGTTIYIAAPEKAGKSTLVNELASHLMLQHNETIFAIKPEESEEGTLRRMAGAAVGKVFYDPKVEVNPEDVERAANLLSGKLLVLERNQTPKWDEVRQLMREAYLLRGVKYFFIDPITNLTAGLSSSERDSFLHKMTREVAEDAKSLGFTVFLFCHLKTIKDGIAWSEGRIATADDFQGSRAMVQSCDAAIAMQAWMLTEGEEAEYKNRRRVLHVLREREYNAVGKVELQWNSYKGKLEEID